MRIVFRVNDKWNTEKQVKGTIIETYFGFWDTKFLVLGDDGKPHEVYLRRVELIK